MMNVMTKLSNLWRSSENIEICRGSSSSWILQIPRCMQKIYCLSDWYYRKSLQLLCMRI